MKNRFNLNNLPLAFFNEFHDIETDEVKEAVLDIVNLMYRDFTIEEVQEMFSTFTSTSYEVYSLFRHCDDGDASNDYKQNLDLIVEVILFCSSQFTSYEVNDPFIHR